MQLCFPTHSIVPFHSCDFLFLLYFIKKTATSHLSEQEMKTLLRFFLFASISSTHELKTLPGIQLDSGEDQPRSKAAFCTLWQFVLPANFNIAYCRPILRLINLVFCHNYCFNTSAPSQSSAATALL